MHGWWLYTSTHPDMLNNLGSHEKMNQSIIMYHDYTCYQIRVILYIYTIFSVVKSQKNKITLSIRRLDDQWHCEYGCAHAE